MAILTDCVPSAVKQAKLRREKVHGDICLTSQRLPRQVGFVQNSSIEVILWFFGAYIAVELTLLMVSEVVLSQHVTNENCNGQDGSRI